MAGVSGVIGVANADPPCVLLAALALALGVLTVDRGLDDPIPPTNSLILCRLSENCSRFLLRAPALPVAAVAAPSSLLLIWTAEICALLMARSTSPGATLTAFVCSGAVELSQASGS